MERKTKFSFKVQFRKQSKHVSVNGSYPRVWSPLQGRLSPERRICRSCSRQGWNPHLIRPSRAQTHSATTNPKKADKYAGTVLCIHDRQHRLQHRERGNQSGEHYVCPTFLPRGAVATARKAAGARATLPVTGGPGSG